jgi:preprotein translocase subunit SecG
MLSILLNVTYVLVAVAMIALVLLQRGPGAQAGTGFGAGASATVFGARGASSFLTKTTKWLAVAFFVISLFMAWRATHGGNQAKAAADLGVMQQTAVPAAPAPKPAPAAVPAAAPQDTVPAAPAQAAPPPAPPAAPAQ